MAEKEIILGEYMSNTERAYLISLVGDYYKIFGWRCLRHCPVCQSDMNTNGTGLFICLSCGYHDYQDVQKLIDAELDYPCPPVSGRLGRKLNRYFGYR